MKHFFLIFLALLGFAYANEPTPVATSAIKFNFSSLESMETAAEKLLGAKTAANVFDEVGANGKVELYFSNDYNFGDPTSSDFSEVSDDVGRTHGYKIAFHENIAPMGIKDLYYVTIAYESNLYTDSENPQVFHTNPHDMIYVDKKRWRADVYFKEENLLKLLISKAKTNDAYFWSVGGGYQELNSDNAQRGVLLSSLGQQKWWHETLNAVGDAAFREYTYIEQQDSSQQGGFATAELGRDFTIYNGESTRGFARVGANTRVSTIEGASYGGLFIQAGHDYKASKTTSIPHVRVLAAAHVDKYAEGVNAYAFLELSIASRSFIGKMKVIQPLTRDPNYLNALPQDFEGRDHELMKKEPIFFLGIEAKFPK